MLISKFIDRIYKKATFETNIQVSQIKKNGYLITRIKPGVKKRTHTNRFKSLLFPLIRQRNRGGDKW